MVGEVRVYSGERSITAAVQEAAPGSRIVISPGLYRESVRIDKPVEIVGDDSDGTVELWPAEGAGLEVRAQQTIIRNIKLHGRSDSPVIRARYSPLVVEDCEIRGGVPTIEVTSGMETTLRRSLIFGGDNGVVLLGAHYITIDACVIGGHRHDGIVIRDATVAKLSILNCQIDTNGGTGIECASSVYVSSGVISDCTIQANQRGMALSLRGHRSNKSYFVVDRCRLASNREAGVYVFGGARPWLRDSEITGPGYTGLDIDTDAHPYITKLAISGGLAIGIRIDGMSEDAQDRGIGLCTIAGTTTAGICIRNGAHPYISASEIMNNNGVGVDIQAGASPTILACKIMGNKGGGIVIRTNAGGEVYGCTLEDNSDKNLIVEPGGNTAVTQI